MGVLLLVALPEPSSPHWTSLTAFPGAKLASEADPRRAFLEQTASWGSASSLCRPHRSDGDDEPPEVAAAPRQIRC
jgi:hypothetical protein